MVLLPKPQKPPTSPGNLRPISILPAIAKTLARATAQAYPQFAYANRRQTLDALDRVHSHCTQVKKRIAAARPQPFAFQPRARPQLQGGMQLSLDLRQAFDRLPRAQLEASLQRISVPPNLISLIMYLHFEMLLVFTKDEYMEEIRTSTIIRQGCGLAPRLWASFTLLTFEKLQQHVSKNQLTFYADDYHVSWNIFSGLQLRNACIQASKIIDELQDSGMQIAIEKTVIIIALGGTQTTQATKDPIQVSKKGRTIRIPTKAGVLQVPVKREHVYLGVKNRILELGKKPGCIQDQAVLAETASHIDKQGLTGALQNQTLGSVHPVCAVLWLVHHTSRRTESGQIRSQVIKQLRLVTRSPAHISHESNQHFWPESKDSNSASRNPEPDLLCACTPHTCSPGDVLQRRDL